VNPQLTLWATFVRRAAAENKIKMVCGKRLDKRVLQTQIENMKLEEIQTSDIASPATSWRTIRSELTFLGVTYFITVFLGSMTIAACGPGCCFVFYSVIAGVSGLLMLRKPFVSRCACLGILMFSLYGMWHEKEARDSWQTFHLRQQLDRANELLQKQNTAATNATNN
jgi:hypothetical protein